MICKQRKEDHSNLSENQLSLNDQMPKLTQIRKQDSRGKFSFIRPKIRVSSILTYVNELGLPEIINKKKRLYCKLEKEFGTEGWSETYAKYFNSPPQTASRIQVEQVKRRKKLLMLVSQKL